MNLDLTIVSGMLEQTQQRPPRKGNVHCLESEIATSQVLVKGNGYDEQHGRCGSIGGGADDTALRRWDRESLGLRAEDDRAAFSVQSLEDSW